jgi:predicted HNH restriction endonuclease
LDTTEEKFSWRTLSDGRVSKEVDYSCFKSGSRIPQDYHYFFQSDDDEQPKDVMLTYEDFNFTCKVEWKGTRFQIRWGSDFIGLLKEKFPKWEKIKPRQKQSGMWLIFAETAQNIFSVDFVDESNFFEIEVDKLRSQESFEKPQGNDSPAKSISKNFSYSRDAKVAAWVLNESGGICESCGKKAPFKKADGQFYLEVHHPKRLADGGADIPENAVAICPNCHRELHSGANKGDLLKKLYKKVERLKK